MASPTEKDFVKSAASANAASSQDDIEKGEIQETGKGFSVSGRKGSVGSVKAALVDDRYAITKRGLKSRHAQMIALGGTIGTG